MAFADSASRAGSAAPRRCTEICKPVRLRTGKYLITCVLSELTWVSARNNLYEGEKGKCFDKTVETVCEEPKEIFSG